MNHIICDLMQICIFASHSLDIVFFPNNMYVIHYIVYSFPPLLFLIYSYIDNTYNGISSSVQTSHVFASKISQNYPQHRTTYLSIASPFLGTAVMGILK